MNFNEWVNKYIGRKTDYDGVYGVQCVDLIDCYIAQCLGLKKGFWGNAKYWWTRRNTSKWLKNNFDFITPKYKNGELKAGDIGIRASGTYGHIFIIKEPTADGRVKYYDQNADGSGAAMTLRTKAYDSTTVTGILRPKVKTNLKVTDKAPVFRVGSTYTLTTNVKVRTGAGTNYAQKKKSDLTADGQKHALSQTYAVLKSGTKVTAQKVIKNGTDTWLKIPSGYIAVYYKGDTFAK